MPGLSVEHLERTGTSLGSTTDTSFTFNLGGGFDIKIRDGVYFRPVQIDWRYSRVNRDTLNGARLSAGFVYRFAE
jgi:hypothetical protein